MIPNSYIRLPIIVPNPVNREENRRQTTNDDMLPDSSLLLLVTILPLDVNSRENNDNNSMIYIIL